jgi:hypothetical protein
VIGDALEHVAALNMLTVYLAYELRDTKIKVNWDKSREEMPGEHKLLRFFVNRPSSKAALFIAQSCHGIDLDCAPRRNAGRKNSGKGQKQRYRAKSSWVRRTDTE